MLQVVKMAITIVCVFVICWLPINTIEVLEAVAILYPGFLASLSSNVEAYVAVYITCHWLAMASSFMNPIIYSFLNDTFRVGTT